MLPGYAARVPMTAGRPELVDEVVSHATAGTSVDLVGVVGSGRSTLLSAVGAELDDLGWTVLRVRGLVALADRPLEALAVAGLASRNEARADSVVAGAVAQLEAVAQPPRSAVLVDDADDLDTASAGVIAAAHERSRLVVVTASRPGAHRMPRRLAGLVHPAVRLAVPALGYVDVQLLLDEMLPGRIDPAVVGRVFAYSGGVPAIARAIADGARRHGALALVDGTWTAAPTMWAAEMAPALDPLVADLAQASREALELLSLVGAVDAPVAQRLVAADALEELDACGLLRFVARGEDVVVGVYPQILAEHVRGSMPGARRLRLERQVAAAFDDDAGGPPLVAPRPAPWQPEPSPAVEAGAGTAAGGPSQERDTIVHRMLVEHWYRRAMELRAAWEQVPSPATAVPYAQALLVGGADTATVQDVLAQTPGDTDPARPLDVLRATFAARVAHDLPGALAILRAAAAADDSWAARFDAVGDHLALLEDRVPPARPAPGATTVPAARDAAALTQVERLVVAGDPVTALTLLDGLDPAEPIPARGASTLRSVALLLDDRVDEALARSSEALARARDQLDVEAMDAHAYVVSLSLLLSARLTELHAHLDSVLSLGLRAPLEGDYQAANLAVGAALAVFEHRVPVARSLSEQAFALGAGRSPLPAMAPVWTPVRGTAGPPGTSPEDRRTVAEQVWSRCRDLLDRGYAMSGLFAGFVSLGLSPDDEHARALVATAADVPAGLARRFGAVAGAVLLPPASAVDAGLGLIADGHGMLGARAVVAAVRRLRAAGDSTAASAAVDEARRRLAAIDEQAPVLLDGVAPAAELTAREWELARLVARGMTNAEIARRLQLSVRTVENHLYRISRKLGTDGRAGLAAALGLAVPTASTE